MTDTKETTINFASYQAKSVKFISPRIVVEWETNQFDEEGLPINLNTVFSKEIDFEDVEMTLEDLKLGSSWKELELSGVIPSQMEFKF